jgi:hypothetical protein
MRLEDLHSDDVLEFTEDLKILCDTKAEEFHILGYDGATANEIWQCVQKSMKGKTQIHQVVEAILGLNIGKFMTHATINAYRGNFGDED